MMIPNWLRLLGRLSNRPAKRSGAPRSNLLNATPTRFEDRTVPAIVNIAFASPSFSINEAAGAGQKLDVVFKIDSPLIGDIVVQLDTLGVTATDGVDYKFSTAFVTLLASDAKVAGTYTRSAIVDIVNDNIVEADETADFGFVSTKNVGDIISPPPSGTTTLTIVNDDKTAIQISDPSAAEAVGKLTFTLTLTNPIVGGLSANIVTLDNTATAGSGDYIGLSSAFLSFIGNAGETQTVTVTVNDDSIVEANETFFLGVGSTSSSFGIDSPLIDITDDGIGTILNDDTAKLTLTGTSQVEAGKAISFTATLDNAVQDGFTVDVFATDGTAKAGVDFNLLAKSVTFLGTAGETKNLSLIIIDDDIVEADETYTLGLKNATVAGVDTSSVATGTILNVDTTTISFGNPTVNEADGTASFPLFSSNPVDGGFTVEVFTKDGTAKAGSDYVGLSSKIVTFVGTANEAQTVIIPIIDDKAVEPNEDFSLNGKNAVPVNKLIDAADILLTQFGVATIIDNDTSKFTIASQTVNEAAGTVTFNVTLTNPVQGGLTVDAFTTDGTASSISPNIDFTATVKTLTFAGTAGEVQPFTVAIINDTLIEGSETFTVGLKGLVPSNTNIDTTATATGTILNDDTAKLSITSPTVSEADGKANFVVTLDRDVSSPFVVNFVVTDGTAKAGQDYTPPFSLGGFLNFAGKAGESQTFSVALINDSTVEATETFTVSIQPITNFDTSGIGTATILNDDKAKLTYDGFGVDGPNNTTVTTLTLDNPVEGGFTVDVITKDGTATAAQDFTVITKTITFTGTAGETKDVIIQISQDGIVEPDESYIVGFGNVVPSNKLINPADIDATTSDTQTILQNDVSTFTIADMMISEGGKMVTFNVTLTAGVTGGLTVDAFTTDGTATAGSDFVSAVKTLTFAGKVGEVQPFTVMIINDAISEPNETFTVGLKNVVFGLAGIAPDQIDSTAIGTATIINDDNTPPTAVSDLFRTPANVPLVVAAPGVLANDTSPISGAKLTAKLFEAPAAAKGSVTFNSDGSFTFTANPSFLGQASFQYTVNDGANVSAPTFVTIDVVAPLLPSAADDTYTTLFRQTLTVAAADGVLKNDAAVVSGANLKARLVTPPTDAQGKLTFNTDGSFTFVPSLTTRGAVPFVYEVSNGSTTATAKATITVADPAAGNRFAAASGAKVAPRVRLFNEDGSVARELLPFEPTYDGGVRVATGDVNGDGVTDVIVGAGVNREPTVLVYDGNTGNVLKSFLAFESSFSSGVFVSVGDFNGDGKADIVVGPGSLGGPRVRVFNGTDFTEMRNFFAYDPNFRGGVRVAAGDVNGDGTDDIVTGAGPSGSSHIKVFDGKTIEALTSMTATPTESGSFFAFDPTYRGGVFVGVSQSKSGPDVIVTGSESLPDFAGTVLESIYASLTNVRGETGSKVAIGSELFRVGQVDIFRFNSSTKSYDNLLANQTVFGPGYLRGVRVAGGPILDGDSTFLVSTASGSEIGSRFQLLRLKSNNTLELVQTDVDSFPGTLGSIFVG